MNLCHSLIKQEGKIFGDAMELALFDYAKGEMIQDYILV